MDTAVADEERDVAVPAEEGRQLIRDIGADSKPSIRGPGRGEVSGRARAELVPAVRENPGQSEGAYETQVERSEASS